MFMFRLDPDQRTQLSPEEMTKNLSNACAKETFLLVGVEH